MFAGPLDGRLVFVYPAEAHPSPSEPTTRPDGSKYNTEGRQAMPRRGHGAPGESGVLKFYSQPDPRPSRGAPCALRETSLLGVGGQEEGPAVGVLPAEVTPTQPFSWAHQPSLGMKLVGPDFPKKEKEISHPKRPAACQARAGGLLRHQRVPRWQKGPAGLGLPNSPSLCFWQLCTLRVVLREN